MANHDSNHAPKERTILWIILPATIAVSLLFTKLNHQMDAPREVLSSEIGLTKKEPKAMPAHDVEHHDLPSAAADSLNADTTSHAAPAGGSHSSGH